MGIYETISAYIRDNTFMLMLFYTFVFLLLAYCCFFRGRDDQRAANENNNNLREEREENPQREDRGATVPKKIIKISISANNIIFNENFKWISSKLIKQLGEKGDVYLIARVYMYYILIR